jgi:hypothetical protein
MIIKAFQFFIYKIINIKNNKYKKEIIKNDIYFLREKRLQPNGLHLLTFFLI